MYQRESTLKDKVEILICPTSALRYHTFHGTNRPRAARFKRAFRTFESTAEMTSCTGVRNVSN
jgi:hypothetical protein